MFLLGSLFLSSFNSFIISNVVSLLVLVNKVLIVKWGMSLLEIQITNPPFFGSVIMDCGTKGDIGSPVSMIKTSEGQKQVHHGIGR